MKKQPPFEAPPDELIEVAVEAVVFASPEPVEADEIGEAFGGLSIERIEAAVDAIRQRYESGGGGLRLERVAGGFRFATRPDVGPWVRQFFRSRNRSRLSAASLETLAIVAYRQPVTAPEIQAIRGKDPTYALRTLLEKRLIRILGRKKVVGNPILYGTSKHFLVHFGLDRLEDLPPVEDFDEFVGALVADAGGASTPTDDPPEPQEPREEEPPPAGPE